MLMNLPREGKITFDTERCCIKVLHTHTEDFCRNKPNSWPSWLTPYVPLLKLLHTAAIPYKAGGHLYIPIKSCDVETLQYAAPRLVYVFSKKKYIVLKIRA